MQEPLKPNPVPISQSVYSQSPKGNPLTTGGPNVFFYIAIISLANSLLFALFDRGFYGSLGITTIITYLGISVAEEFTGNLTSIFIINGIAFGINAVIAGIFAGFGYLSGKGYGWAYIVGIIAYLLDALFTMWVGDWIEVLIHLYVLFLLWKGWSALRKKKAQANQAELLSPSVIE